MDDWTMLWRWTYCSPPLFFFFFNDSVKVDKLLLDLWGRYAWSSAALTLKRQMLTNQTVVFNKLNLMDCHALMILYVFIGMNKVLWKCLYNHTVFLRDYPFMYNTIKWIILNMIFLWVLVIFLFEIVNMFVFFPVRCPYVQWKRFSSW